MLIVAGPPRCIGLSTLNEAEYGFCNSYIALSVSSQGCASYRRSLGFETGILGGLRCGQHGISLGHCLFQKHLFYYSNLYLINPYSNIAKKLNASRDKLNQNESQDTNSKSKEGTPLETLPAQVQNL